MNFTALGHLFHDGETADRLYLIQTGKVAVVLQMVGQDPLSILTVGAGGIVGWSWLFPPYRWHFESHGEYFSHYFGCQVYHGEV